MPEPHACTLTSDEYDRRIAALEALARRSLRAHEPIPDGARLIFRDDPATEQELRAVIAAEAACCAFLRMELTCTGGGLQLDVTGPEGAGPYRILGGAWATASASSSSGTAA